MTWLSNIIHKQCQLMLSHRRHALLQAVAFAILPYTAWLSVAILAFISLRKGWVEGGILLSAVVLVSVLVALSSMPAVYALANVLLTFLPCYLAACVLRSTTSWRAVAGCFFLQGFLAMLLIHEFMPDFVMRLYLYLQSALKELSADSMLSSLLSGDTSLNPMVVANYLLGLQIVGVIFSSSISLACARKLQSQLFYPGGFRQEMLNFRGEKAGLVLLTLLFIAASQQNVLAMNLLPMVMFYFLLAGLSLSLNILNQQRPVRSLMLLLTALFLVPFVMLPVYVLLGALDSLFNFRVYLTRNAGKTI